MIYATMCVGNKWTNKYKTSINNFSKENTLHIFTDDMKSFENCVCHEYTRDVFSYYEKINFVLKLSKEYKERICYIDTDWLQGYDTNIIVDNHSVYTYTNFNLSDDNVVTNFFTDIEIELQKTILRKIGIDKELEYYMGEAILFFPYNENIDDIISDSKTLQEYLENTYHQTTITKKRLDRYKKGIGYAEGWGITALMVKYNIPIKQITNWRKKKLL